MVSIEEGLLAAAALKVAHKHGALFIEKMANFLEGGLRPAQIRRVAIAEGDAAVTKAEADIKIAALKERASLRVVAEELRHQQNIETSIMKALPNVKADAKPDEMDDDWLANFFDKSRLVSNEEMQNLLAQILAGEANQPGTFSHRTVNFLASLTQKEAMTFRKVCAYNWYHRDNELVTLIFDAWASNPLPIALSYNELQHLHEIGLIVHETGFMGGYGFSTEKVRFFYGDKIIDVEWELFDQLPIHTKEPSIGIGMVKLTEMGKELASICKPEIDECVMDYVLKHWYSSNLVLSSPIIPAKPAELIKWKQEQQGHA